MTAAKAREIVKSADGRKILTLARRHGAMTWVQWYQAKGFLAALEGAEIKKLVEFIEKRIADGSSHCCEDCPCGYWKEDLEQAIFDYKKAVGR